MNTPSLKNLIGAYFHQDFYDLTGDEQQTVDTFVREAPVLAERLPREIRKVLTEFSDEDALVAYLDSLGCDFDPSAQYGGYRAWLTEVARRVSAATEDRTP